MNDSLTKSTKHTPREHRVTFEQSARRRFRRARAKRGSQLDFSIRHEVARSTVEDWERGVARLPAWALIAAEEDAPESKRPVIQ